MVRIKTGDIMPVPEEAGSVLPQEENQVEAGEEIFEMTIEVLKGEIDQEKSLERLRILETQLVEHKEKTVAQIFDLINIRRLKRKMGVKNESLEFIQAEFDRALAILEDIKEENKDEKVLKEARKNIMDIYNSELEKWKEILDCEKARDLASSSIEHRAVFVHSFYTAGGQVSVMGKEAKWQDMYRTVLSLGPELATNTMRDGKISDQPYFHTEVGVLLGGGYIQDAGAWATEVRGASRFKRRQIKKRPTELADNIQRTMGDSHGEYVISDPKVAGLFIGTEATDPQRLIEIAKEAIKSELPIYQRDYEDGYFWEVVIDNETGAVIKKRKMTSEEIVQGAKELAPEHKQNLQESLFEDCPFKLDLKDRHVVDNLKQGKREYAEFKASKKDLALHIKNFSERIRDFVECTKNLKEFLPKQLQELNEKLAVVLEILKKIPPEKLEKLKKEVTDTELGDSRSFGRQTEADVFRHQILRARKLQEEIDELTLQLNSLDKKLEEDKFITGCTLYGFAEAAHEASDVSVYEETSAIAGQFVQEKDVEEILKRRLDQDGKFKITEADLKHVYSSSANTDARNR